MMSDTTDTENLTEYEGLEIKNPERGITFGVLATYSERKDAVKMRDVSGTERWQGAGNIRAKLACEDVVAVEADY